MGPTFPAERDAPGAAAGGDARHRARLRMFELMHAVQDGHPLSPAEATSLVQDARRRGWPEVERAGLFLAIICTRCEGGCWPDPAGVAALHASACEDGDPATLALALAIRSQMATGATEDPSAADADRDLARADILLESHPGVSLEHASAHIECARAHSQRGLWELAVEHYDAAEAALEGQDGAEVVLPAILYNRAEVQLDWCAALREVGHADALAQRAAPARVALAQADGPALPQSWREELRIFLGLLQEITPGVDERRISSPPAEGPYAGYVLLTGALDEPPSAAALADARRAVSLIELAESPQVHDLAMCVAAEIEAAIAGGETAGLRYAHHLANSRWQTRRSRLAAMRSLLDVERLQAEHDRLAQDVYLDELTGLSNRRALHRFVDGLAARGVDQVALALVDLDSFKRVNDSHGHAVGDATLTRVAAILRGAVREQDIAVRLGGDEFLLLMSLDDQDAAHRRCESIIDAIGGNDWRELRPGLRVTASLGLACGDPKRFEELIRQADEALYRSKAAGGGVASADRICP